MFSGCAYKSLNSKLITDACVKSLDNQKVLWQNEQPINKMLLTNLYQKPHIVYHCALVYNRG